MSFSCSDLADVVSELLALKGYQIHNGDYTSGETVDDESGEDCWFTWHDPVRKVDLRSDNTFDSPLEAEAAALKHYFARSRAPSETDYLLRDAAIGVVQHWSKGDLAFAVRRLDMVLNEITGGK